MTRETRGFSRVEAGFSSYEGDFWLPLVLAQGSPIFHSRNTAFSLFAKTPEENALASLFSYR